MMYCAHSKFLYLFWLARQYWLSPPVLPGTVGAYFSLANKNIIFFRSFKSPTKVLNAHPGKVESALFQISERPSFGSALKSGSVSSTASTGPRHAPSLNSTSNGTTSKATLTGQHSKKNLSMKENLPSISENPVSSSCIKHFITLVYF